MSSTQISCSVCHVSNSNMLKKCHACGAPLVGVPHAAPPPPVGGGSSVRVKTVGNIEDILNGMCKRFDVVETRCPQCRTESRIAPPFNLDYFECPRCRAALYPFVWIDGCLVDLVGMKELLSAIHFDADVARGVLSALRLEPGRGKRLEPLLHVETVAAHALVALARAATPQLSWWTAAGILHPGLFGSLWVAQLAKAKYEAKKVVEKLLATALARESFDPRVFPPFQASPRTVRVLDRLDFGTGWPEVLYGGAESCAALGTNEASAWSLLIDRRKRLTGKATTRVRTEPFVAEVVSDVVRSERDVDVLRSERELVLARVNELPPDSPLRAGLAQVKGTSAQSSPRARRVAMLNRVIESANLSNGDVDWSCVRSQDQGPMMGVRWVTYHRSPWGRGVFSNGRHVNPSAHLGAQAERKAILDEEGSILDQMLEAVPPWIKVTGLVSVAFLMGWTWLCTAVEANFLAFDSPQVNGVRALFALGLAVTWWVRRKALRNPFPMQFWEPSQLNWEQAKTRRIEEIKIRMSKLWHKFDYAPLLPISNSFGATKLPDRLDSEQGRFAVACQDRLIQDAIVDVAERHGIDMSEFKEGLQQINNYGVIASSIQGPVAAGSSASAQQTNTTNSTPQTTKPSILKKPKAQAGAV